MCVYPSFSRKKRFFQDDFLGDADGADSDQIRGEFVPNWSFLELKVLLIKNALLNDICI